GGRQLRLAAVRGAGRRSGLHRPGAHLGDLRVLLRRRGLRRADAGHGLPARPAAVGRRVRCERRPRGRAASLARGGIRSTTIDRHGPRRHAVGDHLESRRPVRGGQRLRRRRGRRPHPPLLHLLRRRRKSLMPERHASFAQRLKTAASALRRGARATGRGSSRAGSRARAMWGRLRASRAARRLATAAAILIVGTASAGGGLLLVGDTSAEIGPFHTTVALHPDIHGETIVTIPPLGQVVFDSHDGPIGMNLRLDSVDPDEARAIINTPGGVSTASETLASELTEPLLRVVIEALAIVTLCGLLVGALLFRTMRRTLLTGLASLAMTAALMGYAASTMQPESISQPRYEGLLSYAPSVVGNAEDIAENYAEYV